MTLNIVWSVIVDLFQFVRGKSYDNLQGDLLKAEHLPKSDAEQILILPPNPTLEPPQPILKFNKSTFIKLSPLLENHTHSSREVSLTVEDKVSDEVIEQLVISPENSDKDQVILLPPAESKSALESAISTAKAVDIELKEEIKTDHFPSERLDLIPSVMYIQNSQGTNCLVGPERDFDSVIEHLDYGVALTVINYSGRYAQISKPGLMGYVLKEDLTPVKINVWPVFLDQKIYDAENLETKKTRYLIKDLFFTDELGLPLQAGEYVVARLLTEHRVISWSKERPRLAGGWQGLLKGRPGVHSTISPKTDGIMEWVNGVGEGRLAYVEAVSPDKTLTLTAVGMEKEGLFSIVILTPAQWRELRPVFIEVT